jgi:MOSC domain-containing protein YiiM
VTAADSVIIEAVSTGKASPIATKSGLSGIDKRPRRGPVEVGPLGLGGDEIADTENHGGLDQAVYVYCRADYDWWAIELDRPMRPGGFGENLTIGGMASADAAVGDRLVCGELVLEVTSPRIPCATFAAHMNDNQFVSRFFRANRTGFYCRVIAEGQICAGDALDYLPFAGARVPIPELVEQYGYCHLDSDTLARFQATPLHHKLHAILAEQYPPA